MINNAGLGLGDNAFLEALDPKNGEGRNYASWVVMNRVNIDAVFFGTQLAVAEFKRANGGKGKKGVVVNTA
jgi:NAD(P)-dependent dehydrogenase (short-subunit alcohol dehydrogenase family)